MPEQRWATVGQLGAAVTIAYASTLYLPAIVARPIAVTLGLPASSVFLAFSAALLVSALVGPAAGRWVDRFGGRRVLACANLMFAAGLVALAGAQGLASLFAAWLLIGLAMGAGLYETTFATLVRLYGSQSRSAITGVTLIAGFASTLGWPLTSWLEAEVGWRGACLAWAALHLAVALPLHLMLPRPVPDAGAAAAGVPAQAMAAAVPDGAQPPPRTGPLLAFVFGATWFVSTGMAAHLPALLQAQGVGLAAAIALAALVGPAQVAGRLLEYGALRHVSPLLSARIASLAHAGGALAFLALGAPAGVVFTVLHGAGNGVMTIANGTLPLLFFGPAGYGARQGLLMMPARFAQATAPFLFGLAVDRLGVHTLWLSGLLGLASFAALLWLQPPRDRTGLVKTTV